MSPRLPLTALEYFVSLSSTLSFTRTARELRVSQPNVSKQIHLLEQQLGVSLFVRGRRGVALTTAGRELRETVSPGFQRISEGLGDFGARHGREGFQQKPGLRGEVRLGCLPEIGMSRFFAQALDFARQHPGVSMRVSYLLEPEILRRLAGGELDLGIFTRGERSQLLRGRLIYRERIVVAGIPALIRKALASVFRKSPAPFVAFQPGDALMSSVLHAARRSLPFKDIDVKLVVNSHRSMQEALLAGIGLAVLPTESIRKPLESGSLQTLPGVGREDPLYLLQVDQDYAPERLKAFRRHLFSVADRS